MIALLKIAALACFGLSAFLLGAWVQTETYGDVMLVRLQDEKDSAGNHLCAAREIGGAGGITGKWPQQSDGHCHMAEFMRSRLMAEVMGLGQ